MAFCLARAVLQKMHVAAYAKRMHLLSKLLDVYAL